MVSQKTTIRNPLGMDLWPAGEFCKTAARFKSSIKFHHGNTIANAKSVLSVLGACIKNGDEIEIICEGVDEDEALREMLKIVEDGLIEG